MPATTEAVRVSRPVIEIGGQENAGLGSGLLELKIVENTVGLYRCEATFGNWGVNGGSEPNFLYFDRRVLDFGKIFQVKLEGAKLFEGKITALEAHFPAGEAPQITVLAEDRFQDLRMTRRTRSFENVSDADIVKQIAGDYGLTADVNVTGPTHKVLTQLNLSDLAFVRERMRAVDGEIWIAGKTLHAKARSQRNEGNLQLARGQALREFSVIADLAGQRSSVIAGGWDVAGKAALKYEATASVISGELGSDQSGVSILSSAFAPRKEVLAHTVPLTSDEVRARAEAFFKQSARRFVVGRGVTDADARLKVGSFVNLLDLGPLFSGKYYLVEVQHVFDPTHGLRTEFTAERPGIGR